MKRILIFSCFCVFVQALFAQKNFMESDDQTIWSLEQCINENLDDIDSYLMEIAGAAHRTKNERILAMKYEERILDLFAGKVIRHIFIETPKGTKDYYNPLFIDLYAFIP